MKLGMHLKNQKINNKDFYARLIKVDQTIKKKLLC